MPGLKKPRSTEPGPSFRMLDQEMLEHIAPFDIRITCLARSGSSMVLGLGNGMLVELDCTNYKVRSVARRHLKALRVVVPLESKGGRVLATFGEDVVDLRGNVVPNAQCCTWSVADEADSLRRYLEARRSMTRE